tara:strand:- start:2049 stop:2417 length:369 start_codon:yes stop_codon:yes gene_type:complete
MKNWLIINKKFLIIFCIFLFIIIFFTIAALIPRRLIEYTPPGGDDLVHIYVFLILSLLLCFSKIIAAKYVFLNLFSYGFIIEILQFIVGRKFSYFDISYNLIGIGLGVGIYIFFKNNNSKKY